jgi:hypothetical protein
MVPVPAAWNRFEKNFEKIIQEGVEEGIFQREYWKLAVLSILSALNGIPKWYSAKGALSADEIGEAISGFVIKGISL